MPVAPRWGRRLIAKTSASASHADAEAGVAEPPASSNPQTQQHGEPLTDELSGRHKDPKTGEILDGPGTVVELAGHIDDCELGLDPDQGRHRDPWAVEERERDRAALAPVSTQQKPHRSGDAQKKVHQRRPQVRQGQGIEEALGQIGAHAGLRQEDGSAAVAKHRDNGATDGQGYGVTKSGWPPPTTAAQRRNERRGRVRAQRNSNQQTHGGESDMLGCVVLVRDDCRLHDNPALHAALAKYAWVVPLFVHDTTDPSPCPVRGAGLFWKHQSLFAFDKALKALGSQLLVRSGCHVEEVVNTVLECNAMAVFFNRQLEPWYHSRDLELEQALSDLGFQARSFSALVLHLEPWESMPAAQGESVKAEVPSPVPTVSRVPAPPCWPPGLSVDALGYGRTAGFGMPRFGATPQYNVERQESVDNGSVRQEGAKSDWAHQMRRFWEFGEQGGLNRLEKFLLEMAAGHYQPPERYRADHQWTALLSPYLRFGDLSPRHCYLRVRETLSPAVGKPLIRRLFWRDGAYAQLFRWPSSIDFSIRRQYEEQRWSGSAQQLRRWQTGTTGFPLVDAAMRQLWKVGFMPNYLRHVTAQFLIEYLDVSWKEGFHWYDYTLVDSDVAINAMMWQMGGHSGLGAWNFVMHPVFAAKKVDPEGHYVRRWVPELAKLPSEYIHCPWEAPMACLISANVLLGVSYPKRVIEDLNQARKEHVRGVIAVRKSNPDLVSDDGHEIVITSTGEILRVRVRDDIKDNSERMSLMMTPDDPRSSQRRRLMHKGVHVQLIDEAVKKFGGLSHDMGDTL